MEWRRILTMCTLFVLPLFSQAHEYYFSFVELSYSQNSKQYEGTLIAETHDIDRWLEKRGVMAGDMGFRQTDPSFLQELQVHLFAGFKVEQLNFILDGFEVSADGQTYFYFHAKSKELDCLKIYYPLMMNLFEEQQNKVTFLQGATQHTALFLNNKTSAKILCE